MSLGFVFNLKIYMLPIGINLFGSKLWTYCDSFFKFLLHVLLNNFFYTQEVNIIN